MMEKMGWSEGKGLGKDEDGILTHVKLKKRTEELGNSHYHAISFLTHNILSDFFLPSYVCTFLFALKVWGPIWVIYVIRTLLNNRVVTLHCCSL